MAKPSLFISYARADDEPFVKRLHEALDKAGHTVWWDRESMESRGKTFLQEIRDAITEVDRVILVVGPKIHDSAYVKAEWEYALEICKVVNPILRLGDYPLVPEALGLQHAVDCRETRDFGGALAEIKRVLEAPSGDLGTLHAVPLLPQWYIRREEDLRDVIKLVCADTKTPVVVTSKQQTVTLQGTGGIGKTTLAAAIAHDCDVRRVFPDGVFWLEIGQQPTITLRQGDIGVTFKDTRDEYPDATRGRSRLSEILEDKQALLILDDVWQREHADAFRVNAPRCRLLITTRQAGLITQLGAVNHGLDILTDEEGVALIEARLEIAGKDNPHREVQRQIVHLLGGHTLAVSIAAAQLAERGADFAPKLLERLQKRQGGDNPFKDLMMEASDRQYNLEATLSLSYDALSDNDKRRFRALGVFAAEGSFDAAAAAAVWGDEADDIDEAEDALHVLWRGSLITREQHERYSQHSLLRMYALALAQREGDAEQLAARHFAHYEAAHGNYDANNDEERHPLIRRDLENILVTLNWGLQNEPQCAIDMVETLTYFLDMQDLIGLRRDLLAKSLETATQIHYQGGQANTLRALGDLYLRLSELDSARASYDRALPIYEQIGARLGQANTLQALGDLYLRLSELDSARASYDRALPIYEQIGARLGQANTLRALGDLYLRLSELDSARASYDRALPIYEQIGARLGQANTLRALGDLYVRLSELDSARASYDRALPIYEQIGARLGQANTLRALGDLYVRLDELDSALPIYEQIGSKVGQANTLQALGDLYLRLSELDSARASYDRALPIYEQIGARLGQANTLQALGDLYVRLSELDSARASYDRALPIYEQIGARLGQANTLQALGDLYLRLDELATARASYDRALPIYEQIGDRLGQANTLQALGDLYLRLDELATAHTAYQDALALYRLVQDRAGQMNTLSAMAKMEADQGNQGLACDYYVQLFVIVDATPAYANHPVIIGWRRKYQELCGKSDS